MREINLLSVLLTFSEHPVKVSREEGTAEASRRFTGKMLDPESGLYYYGGRYYDPELGRFISADPFVPQPGDPQSLNRYSYVENNPVNKIDPSGYKSFWKKIGKFFKKAIRHIINAVRVVTAVLAFPVAPEYTILELTSMATSYMKGRTAQIFSMVTGFAAMGSQVGWGIYDHFNNPGQLVDVKAGQIAGQEALQGAQSYAVPGVYTRTLEEAVQFGKTVVEQGVDFVRWNQSSGPLADLVKAGLEKVGFESALQGAVVGDLAMGASSLNTIAAHSMGTAVLTNVLQNPMLAGQLEGVNVFLKSPIVSSMAIDAAKMVSGANIFSNPNPLDAVTYLGRHPLLAPVGAALIPLIPATHCVVCPGNQ